MNIEKQVQSILGELNEAASVLGAEAQQSARQFSVLMAPTLRIAMQRTLSNAATDLNDQLEGVAEIAVELQGGEPVVIGRALVSADDESLEADGVQMPQVAASLHRQGTEPGEPPTTDPTAEEDLSISRFSLRMPESLKLQAEEAAQRSGVSLNTWVIRTIQSTLSGSATRGSNVLRGWLA